MSNKSNGRSKKSKRLFSRSDSQIITDHKGKILMILGSTATTKLKTGMPSSFSKALGQTF